MPGRKVQTAQPASPASDSAGCSVTSPAGCASISELVRTEFRLSSQARRELVELRRARFQQGEIDRDEREASFIRNAEHYGRQARDVLLSRSGAASLTNASTPTSLSGAAKQMRRAIQSCLDEIRRFQIAADGAIGPGVPRIAALHLQAASKPLRDARAELAPLVQKHGSPGKPYGKALWWGATWTLAHADPNWPRPGSRKSEARDGARAGTAPDLRVAAILHREIMQNVPAEFRAGFHSDEPPDQRTHAIKASEWAKLKRTPAEYQHPTDEMTAEKDAET